MSKVYKPINSKCISSDCIMVGNVSLSNTIANINALISSLSSSVQRRGKYLLHYYARKQYSFTAWKEGFFDGSITVETTGQYVILTAISISTVSTVQTGDFITHIKLNNDTSIITYGGYSDPPYWNAQCGFTIRYLHAGDVLQLGMTLGATGTVEILDFTKILAILID